MFRCRLAGVICNSKNEPREEELVREFAGRVNSTLVQYIPRDRIVRMAELNKKTVIEYDPGSAQRDPGPAASLAMGGQ